jgi:hypothetical protein
VWSRDVFANNVKIEVPTPAHSPLGKQLCGLLELFSRPWFYRRWVIQEAVLCRRRVVCCGTLQILWDALVVAASILPFHIHLLLPLWSSLEFPPNSAPVFSLEQMLIMDDLATTVEAGRPLSLSSLLARCRDFVQTDERDKFYSLSELISDPKLPPPDYTLTTSQVYLNFARYLVSIGEEKIAIFMAARQDRHLEYPSWVPRWPPLEEHQSPGGWDDPSQRPGPQAVVRLGDDLSEIIAQGAFLDRIKQTGPPLTKNQTNADAMTCEDYLIWLQKSTEAIARRDGGSHEGCLYMSDYSIHESMMALLGVEGMKLPVSTKEEVLPSI